VEVAEQGAWTLFWWFEDYSTFGEQYGVVQERARGSRNAYDLERLTTLWFSFQGVVGRGELDAQSVSYDTCTDTLLAELQRLRGEKDRPSTALQAETLLLEVQLVQRLCVQEPPDDVLRSLQDVVLRSGGLVGYPLTPLVECLTQLGQVLEGLTAYDDLFETIVQVASTR